MKTQLRSPGGKNISNKAKNNKNSLKYQYQC